jgi:hypothetical protein
MQKKGGVLLIFLGLEKIIDVQVANNADFVNGQ